MSFIRLSQGQLNCLEQCPPLFQQIYLEQLRSPTSADQQEKQSWGTQFHLLMQQRELGLPIDALLRQDEQLQHSLTALVNAAPEILQPEVGTWREAEHCRTLRVQNYLLTVVYDLLIASTTAQIIDWKTYFQPQNRARLAQNWQTRLYLYVMAETSDYLPEQLSMTYWFVRLPTQPQRLTFTYDSVQHEATRQDLSNLLAQLDRYLKDYLNEGIAFPHIPNCEQSCPHHHSLVGSTSSQQNGDWHVSIAEIEEVALDSLDKI